MIRNLHVAKSKGADYIFNSKEPGTVEKIIETCGGPTLPADCKLIKTPASAARVIAASMSEIYVTFTLSQCLQF